MKNSILFINLLLTCITSAASFYGNHSHLDYRTAKTRHFSLHYPKELYLYADQAAQLAESVTDSLTRRYQVVLPRLDVVLEDALFSNGQANSARHALKLWVSDWGFKLRSTHPWLPDVVTHEFSHIVSLWAGAKTPPWLFGLHLGYQDFYNESVRTDWGMILSSGMAAAWLAEGTAQYESARLGFDRWDSHRDMTLRMAFLEDQVIPLDLMKLFQSEKAIDFERGPYGQGFDMVRFIAERWGDESIPKIWQALGRWDNWSVAGALKSVIGVDDRELFDLWFADRSLKYQQWAKTRKFSQGTRMNAQGFYTANLKSFEGEVWGYSNFGSSNWEGGLFAWHAKEDSSKAQFPDSLGRYGLGAFSVDSIELEKVWLDNGFDLRRVGKDLQILTQAYGERDENGQTHFNLYLYSAAKKQGEYLTQNLNLRHPMFSPDGQSAVAVRKVDARNQYVLWEFDFKSGEGRDLWSGGGADESGVQVFKPVYSLDGRWILFTWYDQKMKRLSVYDRDSGQVHHLLEGGGDYRDAVFDQEGRDILFSSDFDGVFDIYRLKNWQSESHEILRLTRVKGGAFEPQMIERHLHYVGYDADGFNWYQLSADSIRPESQSARDIEKDRPRSTVELQENYEISAKAKAYNALPRQVIVAPIFIGQEAPQNTEKNTEGESRFKAGISFTLIDPVDHNTVDGTLLLEVGEGLDYINGNGVNPRMQSDFTLGWTNKSTPVDFSLRYTRVNMRGRDTLTSEDPAVLPQLTHYSNLYQNIHTQFDYSVFKKGDRLSLGGGWQDIGFNLYELAAPLSYSVYQSFYGTTGLQWRRFEEEEGSAILTPGFGLGLWYRFEQADLFRPNGKFSDSFEVNEAGVISPIFTPYTVQTLHGDGVYVLGVPWIGGVLSAEALGQSLLGVRSNAQGVDDFFLPGIQVVGYPYLDGENVLFRGENSVQFSLRYQRRLYKLNRGWRSLHHVGAFLDLGAHWSTAYNGKFYKGTLQGVSSLHSELRLSNRIFYGIPMEIFVRGEWGLNSWNDYQPKAIGVDGLPTRIHAGLVFRFDNPGELIDLRPRHGTWSLR